MKQPSKMSKPEIVAAAPTPVTKDWEYIAKEIWDEYDTLAIFLESHCDENKMINPFFEKMLPRRFKYFKRRHGQTLSAEEYTKAKERQNAITESLYKNFRETLK